VKDEAASSEPDQQTNALHPRANFMFIGYQEQEQALAVALGGERMHHAWLLSGPRGVGKATLAYRFARVALGARVVGPRPLDADPQHEVSGQIAALSHPDLFVLRRGLNDRGKPRREITVDEVRALTHFFTLAPARGGMRVAIVDAVDDLNRNAANALLKTLEEPPKRSVLLLVCHAPGAALATIRSRCRRLAMRPVESELVVAALGAGVDASLVNLARGRIGRALALAAQDVKFDRRDGWRAATGGKAGMVLSSLYDSLSGEPTERLETVLEFAGDWARQAGVASAGEGWAEAWSALEGLRSEALDLDMDPRHALARAVGILDRAPRS
jgi:DNA polymerase-3 subunit delta'